MLVIFDLDGTLLNTIDDLATAANHALKVCGFPLRSVEECRQFVGNGVTKLLERALPVGSCTPENIARMRDAFFAFYDVHLADQTRPYEGIVALLSSLQARQIQLAVCSNKYQAATSRLVKHFFPTIDFVSVQGQQDGVPVKPHPQMVRNILTQAQATPSDCLYVGDSDVDMQTAKQADVKACAVTWGFRPREVLAAYEPAYWADTPAQILLLPQIQRNNGGA